MIYIHGFKFIYNPARQPVGNASIQQQLALAKKRPMLNPTAKNPVFDERFVPGKQYSIARIRKEINENKEEQVVYTFASASGDQPDINVYFPNTAEAENYIAAMSGNSHSLKEERDAIAKTFQSLSES